MSLQQLLSGDPSRNATVYLAIGILSLVKAIGVRKDSTRFRRELIDAGLFIGIGLVMRRYARVKAEKRAELKSELPSWLVGDDESAGFQSAVKQRIGTEPEPTSSVSERAKRLVS